MVNNIFIYGFVEQIRVSADYAYLRFKACKKVRFGRTEPVNSVIDVHLTADNFKRNYKELMSLAPGDKVEVNAKKKNKFAPAYIVSNQTTKKDCVPITNFL